MVVSISCEVVVVGPQFGHAVKEFAESCVSAVLRFHEGTGVLDVLSDLEGLLEPGGQFHGHPEATRVLGSVMNFRARGKTPQSAGKVALRTL